jgi:hypothetical protein
VETCGRSGAGSQYNYAQFHRAHLVEWPDLSAVYRQLEELQRSGTWQGRALGWLLAELREPLARQASAPAR